MELDLHILTYSLLHNTINMILHLELQAFFFCRVICMRCICMKGSRNCKTG